MASETPVFTINHSQPWLSVHELFVIENLQIKKVSNMITLTIINDFMSSGYMSSYQYHGSKYDHGYIGTIESTLWPSILNISLYYANMRWTPHWTSRHSDGQAFINRMNLTWTLSLTVHESMTLMSSTTTNQSDFTHHSSPCHQPFITHQPLWHHVTIPTSRRPSVGASHPHEPAPPPIIVTTGDLMLKTRGVG